MQVKFWIKYTYEPIYFFLQILSRCIIIYDGKNKQLEVGNFKLHTLDDINKYF